MICEELSLNLSISYIKMVVSLKAGKVGIFDPIHYLYVGVWEDSLNNAE